jgi:Bardet-Biedl syndrome 1 protein
MAARSYVKAVTTSLNPISSNPSDSLKLSAQVHGLGPVFRLVLELQNNNSGKPAVNMFIAFHCDDKIYDIETNHITVPYLVPGFTYHYDTKVRCISPVNATDTLKVM